MNECGVISELLARVPDFRCSSVEEKHLGPASQAVGHARAVAARRKERPSGAEESAAAWLTEEGAVLLDGGRHREPNCRRKSIVVLSRR